MNRLYDLTIKYTAEFLRGVPPDDLKIMAREERSALLDVRTLQVQSGKIPSDLSGKIKKDIARILTVLREGE